MFRVARESADYIAVPCSEHHFRCQSFADLLAVSHHPPVKTGILIIFGIVYVQETPVIIPYQFLE
jgi:hypothetical protein